MTDRASLDRFVRTPFSPLAYCFTGHMSGSGRGQSIQIGAIILFGFLIIGLTLTQVFIVPSENGEVEFNHNQQVQDDMVELRSHLLRSVATGERWTTSVRLGTTYPSRALLLNPPPPGGSLRTADAGAVRIENAAASGEAGDYWNGSERAFPTNAVVYRPSYNVYDNAPTTRFQASVLSNEFRNDTVVLSNQTLVSGRTISLVTVAGDYSNAESGAVSVDPEVVSATNRTVAITDDGGPIRIRVESSLPESEWEALLAGEQHVEGISCDGPNPEDSCGTLTVTLQDDVTYNLQMGEVGIGSLSPAEREHDAPRYVVTTAGNETSVDEGQTTRVTVEVRDQFNNPVPNAKVSFSQPQAGYVTNRSGRVDSNLSKLATVNVTTDQQGRATVTYRAPLNVRSNPTTTFAAWAVDAPQTDGDLRDRPEVALFELTVEDTSEEVDDFDRSQPLIDAVDPQEGTAEDDDLEFVRVFFPRGGSEWTLVDEDGNERQLDVVTTGEHYFVGDPNEFVATYPVDPDRVHDLRPVTLDDGDSVRIVFEDRPVDAFGYEGPTVDERATTAGWSVSLAEDVTARRIEDAAYADANRSSDWTGLTEDAFFGRGTPKVEALGASADLSSTSQGGEATTPFTKRVTFTYSVEDNHGIDTVEFEAEADGQTVSDTRSSANGSLTLEFPAEINMRTNDITITVVIDDVDGIRVTCSGTIFDAGETITKESGRITCTP